MPFETILRAQHWLVVYCNREMLPDGKMVMVGWTDYYLGTVQVLKLAGGVLAQRRQSVAAPTAPKAGERPGMIYADTYQLSLFGVVNRQENSKASHNGGNAAMKRVILALSLFLACAVTVQAQAPYYQGKVIRIIVGYPPGDTNDQWPRLFAQFMGKYIPGNPTIIVQNMPGGGSMIAANYVYSVGKNDGLTLGWVSPALYFDQLADRKETQFDWPKFTWIGTPVESEHVLYMRADSPYKNVEDIRKATVPPRCGATGASSTGHYVPKLMEETIGTKFNIVSGYQGGGPVDLAVERGEVQCRALTIESFFNREPFHTWRKTNFVRTIVQTGRKRDPRLESTPLLAELMEQFKTPESGKRLAKVVLAAGEFGRPMIASPGIAADRVKTLRDAFNKATKDPEFVGETTKRKFDLEPVSGEELESLAKEVLSQPAEIIERMKKLLAM